jgi:hypothetical protein
MLFLESGPNPVAFSGHPHQLELASHATIRGVGDPGIVFALAAHAISP